MYTNKTNISFLKINLALLLFLGYYILDSGGHGREISSVYLSFALFVYMSVVCVNLKSAIFVALTGVIGVLPILFSQFQDFGVVGYDFLQLTAFISVVFLFKSRAPYTVKWTIIEKYAGLAVVVTASICLARAYGQSGSYLRGELPPLLVLAVAASFLMTGRREKSADLYYVAGVFMLASYTAIGVINGYRSTILFLCLVIPVLLLYFLFRAGVRVKKRYKILVVLLCSGGMASLLYFVLYSGYSDYLRALQLVSGDSVTMGSNSSRLGQITVTLQEYADRGVLGILIGSGFGTAASVNLDARVTHNIWVTIVARHGVPGIIFTFLVHYCVVANAVRLFRSKSALSELSPFSRTCLWGGGLALMDSHLRFSWSDPASLFLMAAVTGQYFYRGRRRATKWSG